MIVRYQQQSIEVELHPGPHREYDAGGYMEDTCECEFVSTVQAEYDYKNSHKVRFASDRYNTWRSTPIWLTPNQARELASQLCFAANDADTLNKEFPV